MLRMLTAPALAVLLLPAMLWADDAPKGDKDLDGEWQLESSLHSGKAPPADAPKPMLSIHGSALTIKDGDKAYKATLKIDAGKTPRTLDMTIEEGESKGKTALAIYEVKGDELRVCNADSGKDRPAEFSSTEDNGNTLMVLKRVKK
jgi:uncharacterized protein (TIGR03067 family)